MLTIHGRRTAEGCVVWAADGGKRHEVPNGLKWGTLERLDWEWGNESPGAACLALYLMATATGGREELARAWSPLLFAREVSLLAFPRWRVTREALALWVVNRCAEELGVPTWCEPPLFVEE